MSWAVPLTSLELSDEDVAAYVDCLSRGWLTMGPRVQELEEALAGHLGVRHACAVSSGTAALLLALRAVGVGAGDEVLLPGAGFVAAAHAVGELGARPVFVDVRGPSDTRLDLDGLEAARTPRTRAVLPMHMLGDADDVPALRAFCEHHGLALVEDAAQAIDARDVDGAPVGTTGDAGCFSFFSKKQLACGEGGAVLTNRDDVAASVRSLRSHAMTSVTWDRHRGHAESYDVLDLGYNFRLDEPRAALLGSRLPRLRADIEKRRARVAGYRERFADRRDRGFQIAGDDDAVRRGSHFGFAVVFDDEDTRERVRDHLRGAGVQSTCYPAFTFLTRFRDHPPVPNAEAWARRHLVLPLSSHMDEQDLDTVADGVLSAAARR